MLLQNKTQRGKKKKKKKKKETTQKPNLLRSSVLGA